MNSDSFSQNLRNDTLKAASWNYFQVLIEQVRNFIVSIILARLLMPQDFGLLGMAFIFASLSISFVDFGFGNSIIRTKDINQIQLSTVFWINIALAVILGLLMYLTAPLVAMYFEMPGLKPIAQIMSVSFLVKGLSSLQTALFKKKLDYKTLLKINIAAGIISGIIGIYMAYNGFGVNSLIFSQIAGWIIISSLLWYFSTWTPSFIFRIHEVKELWSFGYKYSLSVFLDQTFSRLDTLIIGKLFNASTLGLFYKAESLNKMVIQFSFSAFSGVLFPSLSKLADDKERLLNAMQKILHIVCFTTFLFSGLMYINAKEIIVLLLTEKWIDSVPIFKILGLFSFVYTIPTILVTPILSIGESGANLKVEMIKKTLLLISIPVAIYYGLYAYIYAISIASVIGIIFNLVLVRKYFDFKFSVFFRIFFTYAIPFVILLAINEITPEMFKNNVLHILVYSTLYAGIYIFLNAIILKSEGFKELIDILKPLLGKIRRLR